MLPPHPNYWTSETPTVLFAMRYPDSTGFVWNSIAKIRDQIAQQLMPNYRCILAYPELTDSPHMTPRFCAKMALNLYTKSENGLSAIKEVVNTQNVKLILYMSAAPHEIAYGHLKSWGVAVLTTENNSPDTSRSDPMIKRLAKRIMRAYLKRGIVDMHIANSQGNADFLANYAQVPRSRVTAIPNGIDSDHFRPGDRVKACRETGLDANKLWIVCASQARPEKRIGFMLEAAKNLLAHHSGDALGFVHVGGGGALDSLRRQCRDMGLESQFLFAGSQRDPAIFFRAASVFIHAAERESFGNVMAEAMASEVPVVATRSSGAEELIVPGVTGQLIEKDDKDGFVAALQRYIGDQDLRNQHGKAGRVRILQQFDRKRQVADYTTLLREYLPPYEHD